MPAKLSLAPKRKAFCVRFTIFCMPAVSLDSSRANLTIRQVQKLEMSAKPAPALAKTNPDASVAGVVGADTLAKVRTTPEIVVRITWHHQLSQPTRHNASALRLLGSVARATCAPEASSAARLSMAASTSLPASAGVARRWDCLVLSARRTGGRSALAQAMRLKTSVELRIV